MIVMVVQTEQVITALLIGLPSFLLGYLAYRRARKVDAVAAQSGVVTETRAGTAQIIEGLNLLVDQLQDDNRTHREDMRAVRDDIRDLTLRLGEVSRERDELRQERDELKRELARLQRKYGVNGNGIPRREDQ